MKDTLVLYPAPNFPHLVSLVELGKLIQQHQSDLFITVLVPPIPSDCTTTNISQTQLPISFISLPPLQLSQSNQNQATTITDSIGVNALNALHALETLSSTFHILALVTSAMHENLNTHIPTYSYFSSCASALAFFLYLPTFHNQTTESFDNLNQTHVNFPGLPPIRASYVPEPMLNRDNPAYSYFLSLGTCLLKSQGVIVNTFNSLEPRAIEAITDGICVPNDPTPPIFYIGPLITSTKDHVRSSYDKASQYIAWLEKQPRESVVFLCFGSRGVFSEAQLREIAIGLERSNQRFLWVVKSPLGLDTEPKLEELLPQDFLERTKEKGLIVKSWAPQNAILSRKSIGGFVTHCGWNSVLEAVKYGVPMVAWPLYSEQHMNSVVMVEEMKLAIPIRGSSKAESKGESRDGLVGAEEVERTVRQLMELEEGKTLRQRSTEMKVMAKAAWSSGGSSFTTFSKLLGSWKQLSFSTLEAGRCLQICSLGSRRCLLTDPPVFLSFF